MLVRLIVGMIQANCYILGCKKTGEAAVIDPGGDAPRIVEELVKRNLKVRTILNTHGHWDHTGGNEELKRITRAPLLIHQADKQGATAEPDGFLEDGQKLQVGSYTLRVIHTPGHSPGGVCLFSPGTLFSGDTLFAGSIGRTDMPGGSLEQLLQGVREKLFCLDETTRVYPGHGPSSTIGQEKSHNPFFR